MTNMPQIHVFFSRRLNCGIFFNLVANKAYESYDKIPNFSSVSPKLYLLRPKKTGT